MTYPFLVNFFSIIDTEEKAYWLGFLAADGNVGSNNPVVSIHLSLTDVDHLSKIRQSLQSTHPIKIYNKSCYFTIRSKILTDDLKQYGIVPRKDRIVRAPQIDTFFVRHFWRGVIDGDGCLYKRTHQKG